MTSEADEIVGLYQRYARIWAQSRGKQLFERAWLDRFCALLPTDASILDIGCGSGEPIARYLIRQGYKVTGVDAAPQMIAMCNAQFPDGDWRVADMRTLSLDREFNGILAWDSFFHLRHRDQRRMFSIFQKLAARSAALMFTSGPSHSEVIGTLEGEPLYHASLDPSEYRALLNEHGFGVVKHAIEDQDCNRHTVWLAQRI